MKFQRFVSCLSRYAQRVAAFLVSKDVATFLFFLVLAFVMWLLHGSSNSGKMHGSVTVVYDGVPTNVRFHEPLPAEVRFEIRDEGAWAFDYLFFDQNEVRVDLSGEFEKGHAMVEVDFAAVIQRMFRQHGKEVKLLEVTPPLFETSYTRLEQKQVPIVFSGTIGMQPNMVLLDSVTLSPSRTTVCGSAQELAGVGELRVDKSFKSVAKSISAQVALTVPEGIIAADSVVNISIPVEMATEKELVLPVEFRNLPDGVAVRTFPAEAVVKFLVGLSHYKQVTAGDFSLVFDYNEVRDTDKTSVRVRLERRPSNIQNVRINPSEVEFVIVGQ